MELMNNIFVVSLTHWDREWRFSFEKTRMLLVQMLDSVLNLLDNNPDYKCFHLDGQTILLDDYCEVRPENAEKIRTYVKAGRLKIGPWFVLPEENQMSGESLIRNFLWGERVGRRYGGNMKVGYSPTSWGQVSQMPQIMQGFGIDSVIFYRGISAEQSPDNYYIWEGPDGSRLLGIRLGDFARVSFFHLVDRAIVFNRGWGEELHDWNQGGKPYRLSGSGSGTPYEFYQPPMGWYPENIEPSVEKLQQWDMGKWMTPWALAPECDDCTGPFALTLEIIKEIAKRIDNDKQIKQGDLEEFVQMAKEHLDLDKLKVLYGEMRHPQRRGRFTDIYAEVQACRIPTKYVNRRAEFALQRVAEPIATMAWTLGREYPKHALDRANWLLLQCHAHDSIGGCSRDVVDEDVRYRFSKVQELSQAMTEDAARDIAGKIDTRNINADEVLVVVWNNLPRCISQVVKAEIDLPCARNFKGVRVCNMDGSEVRAQIISKRPADARFNHPTEAPCRMISDRYEIYLQADAVPAMGYRVFRVIPSQNDYRHVGSLVIGSVSMANKHMEVHVNPNGSANILSKETSQLLINLNIFEDRGEVGDYWVGNFPYQDKIITSLGAQASIAIVEDGPLVAAIEAKLVLNLPIRAAEDATYRVEETRKLCITTRYKLIQDERFLRITTTIENTVEDHILRALFPTGINTDIAYAETPFDVVERKIPLPDTRDWREPYKPVQPHQNFADLSDGEKGVAILNRGLPQYEAVDDPDRTIAITLIRAHRAWNSIRLTRYPDQFGTQLQGTYTFEYAVLPHSGNWEQGKVLQESEILNIDPVVGAAGSGEGTLPAEKSFIELQGDGLVLNAVKKGEWDDSLILRVSNPTGSTVDGSLKLGFAVKEAMLANHMETECQGQLQVINNSVQLTVKPKKILTIKFIL